MKRLRIASSRYKSRLEELAKRKLGPRLRRRVSSEDVMIMAMNSVLCLTRDNSCTFDRNGSLWGLVSFIAERIILRLAEYHGAPKRNVAKEESKGADSDKSPPEAQDPGPSPVDVAEVAEILDIIEDALGPESFMIFEMKLEGHSNQEIGNELGITRQSVYRKWKRIEKLLYDLIKKKMSANSDNIKADG